tara:strand:- start:555 stop:803 length:249 start_codon:yes stop_codon:yes gene_type:complete
MSSISVLLVEALQFLPVAVKAGMDVAEIVSRAHALINTPTPATADELAAFAALLAAQRVRLDSLTQQLNADRHQRAHAYVDC